jgi:hypothetical protein
MGALLQVRDGRAQLKKSLISQAVPIGGDEEARTPERLHVKH